MRQDASSRPAGLGLILRVTALRIIRAQEHRRMPWKNGGGETAEIIAFPEGAGLDEFDWRVSMARVATGGAFSVFPGIDRTLCLIDGEGLALTIAPEPEVVLTLASPPFAFPGDVPVASRLVNGTVTDLNVMTRRGRWSHKVTRLFVDRAHKIACEADVTLLLSRSQGLMIAGKDGLETLDTDDAALFEGAFDTRLEPAFGAAIAFRVELRSEAS